MGSTVERRGGASALAPGNAIAKQCRFDWVSRVSARITATMSIRIPVNLATEPFRRDRPIIVCAVALSAVLVGVLALQGYTIWSERNQAADTRLFLDGLKSELGTITSKQQKLE